MADNSRACLQAVVLVDQGFLTAEVVEVFAEEREGIESLSGADLIFFDIVLLPSDR